MKNTLATIVLSIIISFVIWLASRYVFGFILWETNLPYAADCICRVIAILGFGVTFKYLIDK